MTERGEMEATIEAILFVSSEPVPRTRVGEMRYLLTVTEMEHL